MKKGAMDFIQKPFKEEELVGLVERMLDHARIFHGPVRDFVGHDPGDLLVLHVDVDLKLPFPDKDREVQLLQLTPAYWTTGTGTFDGQFGPSGWELKTTPIKK